MAHHNLNHQAADMLSENHILDCLHVGLLGVMDVIIIANVYRPVLLHRSGEKQTETLDGGRISKSRSVAGSKRVDRVVVW